MDMLKRKWLVIGFNMITLLIFLPLLLPQLPQLHPENLFRYMAFSYDASNVGLIGSEAFQLAGRWAIRFLIVSLAISPLLYLFGWRKIVPLRKWAGLWAFAFAGLHMLLFFADAFWAKVWYQDYTRVGLAALVILGVMALTSHKPAMKLLGRNWKRLHRLVYVAGVLVVLHSINGIITYQKLPDYNTALTEVQVYGLIIGVLLLLRIPTVRHGVLSLLQLPKIKQDKIKSAT